MITCTCIIWSPDFVEGYSSATCFSAPVCGSVPLVHSSVPVPLTRQTTTRSQQTENTKYNMFQPTQILHHTMINLEIPLSLSWSCCNLCCAKTKSLLTSSSSPPFVPLSCCCCCLSSSLSLVSGCWPSCPLRDSISWLYCEVSVCSCCEWMAWREVSSCWCCSDSCCKNCCSS